MKLNYYFRLFYLVAKMRRLNRNYSLCKMWQNQNQILPPTFSTLSTYTIAVVHILVTESKIVYRIRHILDTTRRASSLIAVQHIGVRDVCCATSCGNNFLKELTGENFLLLEFTVWCTNPLIIMITVLLLLCSTSIPFASDFNVHKHNQQ